MHGATIVDAADHAFTGFYGPPPVLSVIQAMKEYGKTAIGINEEAVIETSDTIRDQRRYYAQFESQIKGFQPTVQIHKLPGGAMGSSLEQAAKGGFLDKMADILHKELPRVQKDLGNYWSVTPGSQILWTTAVSNVLDGERYGNPSGDLKNLLLGKYGPFPFYRRPTGSTRKPSSPTGSGSSRRRRMPGVEDIDIEEERKARRKLVRDQLEATRPLCSIPTMRSISSSRRPLAGLCLPPSIFFHGAFSGRTADFQGPCRLEHVIEIGHPEDRTGQINVYPTSI
jgi:pyruvate carboxylase